MVDATQVVVQLIGDTANMDQKVGASSQAFSRSMQTIERSANQAEGAVRGAHEGIAEASGRSNAAQLILQSTVRRTTDQFAAGAPIATIFAEHISALAEASSLAGSSFGKFGEIMEGPWGIAITSAISIAALLAQKLYDGADAQNAHAKAAKSNEDAIHDLNVEMGKEIQTSQEAARANYDEAQSIFAKEVKTRNLTIAKLQQAQADARAAQNVGGAINTGSTSATPQVAAGAALGQADALQAEIDKQNKAIVEGANNIRKAAIPIMMQHVKEATDAAAAANGRYERTLASLNAQYQKPGSRGADYQRQLEAATRLRDAQVKAAQANGRGSGSTGDADAQARLATATNAVQKAEAQLAITRRDGAAAVKAGKLSQADYEQQLESGMQKVNDAKAAVDAHKLSMRDGAKAAREAAAAQRELDSALDAVIKKFDPARAAAEEYARTMQTITDAVAAGKLTPDQGIVLSYKVALDKQAQDKKTGPDTQATSMLDSAVPDISTLLKNHGDVQDGLFKVQQQNQEKLKAQQQRDVESLANTFDRLFEGGTKNIWQTFKEEGEREIAYLLAKLVVLQATQGGSIFGNIQSVLGGAGAAGGKGTGGIGGIIGAIGGIFGGGESGAALSSSVNSGASSALSSLLAGFHGLASGGYAAPGSIHRVNESGGGVELLRMGSQGGTVIPLGQTRAAQAGGGTTVVQHISVDGRNSVTPSNFARDILSQANSFALQASATSGRAAVSGSTGQVRYDQARGV